MATAIAMMIGSAVVNALAFTGGNYLFSTLGDRENGETERLRHDKAVEDLQKATENFNEKRMKTLDFVNRELQAKRQAESDFNDVDEALRLYNQVTLKDEHKINLGIKPTLANFYKPSVEQQNYEYIFIMGGVGITGLLVYKIL
jgi:hypothetical protein